MEILKVGKILLDDDAAKITAALKNGEVIMHATETCYGFTCDFFQTAAWERLFVLKRMHEKKPVSIMVTDLEQAGRYGVFDERSRKLAAKFWPGPLTIVVPRTDALPPFFNEGIATVGIRCPDFVLARQLVELNGRPLCTTSANISGQAEVYKVEDYLAQVEVAHAREGIVKKQTTGRPPDHPAIILDSGILPMNPPSTIVRFEGKNHEILRRGRIAKDVEDFLL